MGGSVALAEEAWDRATSRLEAGEVQEAREQLAVASRLATEARDRRIQEVKAVLSSVEDHIALARTVGANADEAESYLAQARLVADKDEYVRAWELAKRAERLAMQGQQRQIEKALELRETQMRRAQEVIAANEPLVQEAESYGLDAQEVRTLLRQARDVLARGDYVGGLTFARNADDAVLRLESLVVAERRKRGILKPTEGICGVCQSRKLHFYDDGWGRCLECGSSFRWRGPVGIWETLRGILGT